jgi:glycosyltransferase involved in cell wall biosynthesis
MTRRLAILASHVIQYQDPFFRLLAREAGIDLTVIYCSPAGADVYRDEDMNSNLRWDLDLLQGYRYEILHNFGFDDGYTRLINPGIVPHIVQGRYDAVIFMMGWGSISSLLGIAACRGSGTPFYLFGDSSFPPGERSLFSKLRATFLRALFALADGFMVSGVLNAAYYRHYGAPEDRFFLLPWAVDNDRFTAAGVLEPAERAAVRKRWGLEPDRVLFVFSAKLVERKDPMTLLHAYRSMRHRSRASLLFVGDGELRTKLEEFVREFSLENEVRFTGFVNQTELPTLYGVSDVFVLPSLYEPRGAVINEAMACGLPVIVTDRCGSIGDIVMEGDNASIYPAGNVQALAEIMDRLTMKDELRVQQGRRSLEIIANWNFARGVDGVKEMLQAKR